MLIGIVGTLVYYNGYILVERHEIPLYVEIVPNSTLGFNVDNTSLNFGKVPITGRTRKQFDITNNHDFPVLATFYPDPSISNGIQFDPSRPVIPPGQTHTIKVHLSGPGIAQGIHNTTLLVTLTRS